MAKKTATRGKSARKGSKTSTALVRATKKAPAKRKAVRPAAPPTGAPTVPSAFSGPLTEEANMGALGLVELSLSAKEEAVLAEPVDPKKVRLLPSGLVYYPHGEYRRWLNRAFGRLGWSLRPITKPLLNDRTVGVYYILFVHGQPVAQAFGAQEYHADNRQMSWDDAIEATEASALRRIMKRLGVSLELWDRQFNGRFLAAHGVKVVCQRRNRGEVEEWRLKDDPHLPGELRVVDVQQDARRQKRRAASAERGATVQDPEGKITDVMVDKLMTAIAASGRNAEDVKKALGVAKLGNLRRGDFERALKAIEASDEPLRADGSLPL